MVTCKSQSSNPATMRDLSKERNAFAKSRQEWIQASFNLNYRFDSTLFNKLVEEELCEKCKHKYQL
jgi:hypothetical protein